MRRFPPFADSATIGSMALETTIYQPGKRVRVIQQIPHRDEVWTNTVEGVITRYQQTKTGSWYAHSKDDRLWLDRLEIRLDDGEIVTLNLDQYTRIEDRSPGSIAAEAESGESGKKPSASAH